MTNDLSHSRALAGYVIQLGYGYVKWWSLDRWGIEKDPIQATVFSTSDAAMAKRPYVNGKPSGAALLLRTCVR